MDSEILNVEPLDMDAPVAKQKPKVSVPPAAAFREAIRCGNRLYYGVSVKVNETNQDAEKPVLNVESKRKTDWKRRKTLNPLLTGLTVRQLKKVIQESGNNPDPQEKLNLHLFSPASDGNKRTKTRNYPIERTNAKPARKQKGKNVDSMLKTEMKYEDTESSSQEEL